MWREMEAFELTASSHVFNENATEEKEEKRKLLCPSRLHPSFLSSPPLFLPFLLRKGDRTMGTPENQPLAHSDPTCEGSYKPLNPAVRGCAPCQAR